MTWRLSGWSSFIRCMTIFGEDPRPYADKIPVLWVQEEPENMGAWRYLHEKFGEAFVRALAVCARGPRGIGQPGHRFIGRA